MVSRISESSIVVAGRQNKKVDTFSICFTLIVLNQIYLGKLKNTNTDLNDGRFETRKFRGTALGWFEHILLCF